MTHRRERPADTRKQPSLKKKTLKDLEPDVTATGKARGGLSSIMDRKKGVVTQAASFSRSGG